MRVEQRHWIEGRGWTPAQGVSLGHEAQLVFAFGARAVLEHAARAEEVRALYPNAQVVFCSTAGEIFGTRVTDDSLVVTALAFDATQVVGAQVELQPGETSEAAGERLARQLPGEGLVHLLIFSDGLHVNGTHLLRGLERGLPAGTTVTGGLSGDGDRFQRTLVGLNRAPTERVLVGIGLYGPRLRVGFGSLGGWDPFGPERRITRSRGNVLFELDGTSALDLYKRYLGEHAAELPASALLFPLALRTTDGSDALVRTVLAVDEAEGSMTFAGDMPEGAYVRLMKANFDRLVDGADGAARAATLRLGDSAPALALLISCVGRKMVLRQRTEEEVESVQHVLGSGTMLTGFYSYGEISPVLPSARCELHNQTMTVTTLAEA